MTLNDVLTKQNVIAVIKLSSGDRELSKELKVKIMRIRIAYNKIKKHFDEDAKEFSEQIIPDELRTLAAKSDKTTEEENRFVELTNKVNAEYKEFLIQKGTEEITKSLIDDSFTEEEWENILDINSDGEYEINNQKVKAADLMEAFYELFVK